MPGRATTNFMDLPERDLSRFIIEPEMMGTVVIFGATGDLAGRKLIPAIYNLWQAGYLPRRLAVVGAARRAIDETDFRQRMCEALKKHCAPAMATARAAIRSCRTCIPAAAFDEPGLRPSQGTARCPRGGAGAPGNRLYYMAVAPEFFATTWSISGRRCTHGPGCPP